MSTVANLNERRVTKLVEAIRADRTEEAQSLLAGIDEDTYEDVCERHPIVLVFMLRCMQGARRAGALSEHLAREVDAIDTMLGFHPKPPSVK